MELEYYEAELKCDTICLFDIADVGRVEICMNEKVFGPLKK